jgi:hypothetical protein
MAARNMQRLEINVHEKELCVKLVIYKDYTKMHGQQNIKYGDSDFSICMLVVNTSDKQPYIVYVISG